MSSVRLKTRVKCGGQYHAPGVILSLPDADAQYLVEQGAAETILQDSPETVTAAAPSAPIIPELKKAVPIKKSNKRR